MPWVYVVEGEKLFGLAPLVERTIGVDPVGAAHDFAVVGRHRRARRGGEQHERMENAQARDLIGLLSWFKAAWTRRPQRRRDALTRLLLNAAPRVRSRALEGLQPRWGNIRRVHAALNEERSPMRSLRLCVLHAFVLFAAAACTSMPPDYGEIVRSSDRVDADRSLDQRRKPEQLLAFYAHPGMRVLDLSAGRGYNTELLARAVGSTGQVYAPKRAGHPGRSAHRDRRADEETRDVERAARAARVQRSDSAQRARPRSHHLQLQLSRHRLHGRGPGTHESRAVRCAEPGGVLIVADHSAKPGAGLDVTKSLHRIDEAVVKKEVEAAGFRLVNTGDFLRNPLDPREVPVFKNSVPNDEFVLKFVKPK